MRNKIAASLLGLALTVSAFASPLPASAADDAFSETQKKELHNIIREYMLANPELLNGMIQKLQVAERENQEKQARDAIGSNADKIFRSAEDVVIGNPEGNVTVVEFFDYNCGYCKRSMADVLRLTEEDENVRVVMKEFPILSEGSVIASHAALAARKQNKYWELHVALMGAQGNVDGEEKVLQIAADAGLDVEKLKADMQAERAAHDKVIDETRNLAQQLGINGTPAFIIDGQLVPGAVPYEQLAAGIKDVRNAGGCKFC